MSYCNDKTYISSRIKRIVFQKGRWNENISIAYAEMESNNKQVVGQITSYDKEQIIFDFSCKLSVDRKSLRTLTSNKSWTLY